MTQCQKYANVKPLDDFDWGPYEDGWNGVGLRENTRIKRDKNDPNPKAKIYCHEKYAQELYYKFLGIRVEQKDITEGLETTIKDIQVYTEGPEDGPKRISDKILVHTMGGNAITINLVKENKFLEQFRDNEGNPIDKEVFKRDILCDPAVMEEFRKMEFTVKVDHNGQGSLWGGWLSKKKREYAHEAAIGDKSIATYQAEIIGYNRGGYNCIVNGIQCFMPFSHSGIGKDADQEKIESLIGKTLTVMMDESKKNGKNRTFVASRTKYIRRAQPQLVATLKEEWKKDVSKVYNGVVTGIGYKEGTHRPYGIFIEVGGLYTGLLFRTYMSDGLLDRIQTGEVKKGDTLDVFIHDITERNAENGPSYRIVFSDVPLAERTEIITKREEEELKAAKKNAVFKNETLERKL